jgi:hypothetical protein
MDFFITFVYELTRFPEPFPPCSPITWLPLLLLHRIENDMDLRRIEVIGVPGNKINHQRWPKQNSPPNYALCCSKNRHGLFFISVHPESRILNKGFPRNQDGSWCSTCERPILKSGTGRFGVYANLDWLTRKDGGTAGKDQTEEN